MKKKPVKCNMSALKRERQDKVRKASNHFRWHTMQTYIKRARAAKTLEAFMIAQKHIAVNVKFNVIHANAGARLTSRLHKLCTTASA